MSDLTVSVEVSLGERSYPVVISHEGFSGLGSRMKVITEANRVVVVTEENVAPLWCDDVTDELVSAGFVVEKVVLPAGEESKNTRTWAACVDAVLSLSVDRGTPILALGGGVLGDITGFCAASVLRGVPFIQLPTTLLSMVDSSVGGKTGVNHRLGKNLIGAFYQPKLVFASLQTLSTLPPEERSAGLGEVVKSALIADADLFAQLERDASALARGDDSALASVIARCVEIKAEVVSKDELEGGYRAILNAGHTVGHGIENASGYGVLRHGEAVGIGLVYETAWAIREGICQDETLADRVEVLLKSLGLPTALPDLSDDEVVKAMKLDKKAKSTSIKLPAIKGLGEISMVDLPLNRLGELLRR